MLGFLVLGRVEDREVTAYQGTEGEYLKVNCAPIQSHPPAQYSWVVTDSDEGTEDTEIMEDERIFIDHEGKCDNMDEGMPTSHYIDKAYQSKKNRPVHG